MKLETKYNIGDEVWLIGNHALLQGKIIKLSLDVEKCNEINISYFVQTDKFNGWVDSEYVFRTKQELLDSL